MIWQKRLRNAERYQKSIGDWQNHLLEYQLRAPKTTGAPNSDALHERLNAIVDSAQAQLQESIKLHFDEETKSAEAMAEECRKHLPEVKTEKVETTDIAAILRMPAIIDLIKAQALVIAKEAEADNE